MDLLNILPTVLGTAVSIFLFVIAHRQTIGARRERIRSANDEIEKILVRRIVLEGFAPTQEEIVRLIDTKARDFRARPTDLLSDSQFMNNIYTRIVESDFILREQRQQILDRVGHAIEVAEEQPVLEQAVDQIAAQKRSRSYATYSMVIAAVVASLVGSTFSILPEINEIVANTDEFSSTLPLTIATVFATVLMSLIAISFISLVYRIRERQQEQPNKASTIENYLAFENEVFGVLKKSRVSITKRPVDGGGLSEYDFLVERTLPIRLTPMTATCRVPPLSRVKLGIGWSRGVARDAEQ